MTRDPTQIAPDDRSRPGSREATGPGVRYLQAAGLGALLMAAAFAADWYVGNIPAEYFVPSHIVLELSSIVVSLAVFVTGWFGYKHTGSLRDLLIGTAFAAAGAVDLVHTLSYRGMPDFLSINTAGKAAAFWLLARMIVGIGLVAACVVSSRAKPRAAYPVVFLAAATAIVVGSCVLFNVYGLEVSTALYPVLGSPPSPLKVVLEYVIIAVYLLAFVLLSDKGGWEPSVRRGLQSALIFAMLAEVAFTMYLSPYAWVNALGHVLKTVAYILILNALFVSAIRRPYEELSQAKDQVQALYLDAREHRREMEKSFGRIGSALSSSLNISEALDLIADLTEDMLHVDCSVVVSMGRLGETARVASQRGTCHELDNPVEITLALGRRVLADGSTLVHNDVQSTGWVNCDFKDPRCLRSVICAPLVHDGSALGVIAVYSYKKQAFEEGDVRLLEGFASHAAVAIHNAVSFEHEARIADVLQHAFLSESTVITDRFEIAQVYEPATNEALVGGDFYDVFEAPHGGVALVIGDVSGKGLRAAVHTAMVRYSLRAYVIEGHSPASALNLLNRTFYRHTDPETFVTVFVGVLDPATGTLVYASAGHEPPVYSCRSTQLTLLTTGPAVGIYAEADFGEGTAVLEPGCVMLLYTDGISEARSGGAMLGTDGIGQKLLTCENMASGDVARCIHRAAIEFAGGELKDDAAILAVRAIR